MPETTLLHIEDLRLYFRAGKGTVRAVDGVNFDLNANQAVVVLGESGCGKTSLAKAILRLLPRNVDTYDGKIYLHDLNVMGLSDEEYRRQVRWLKMSMVPQAAMNALNPTQKVIHFIEDVIKVHDLGATKKEIYERAKTLFETVGLPESVLQRYPVELSGGMKQRTVIAISVLLSPKVLIADEPSSALDVTSQKMVIKMIKQLLHDGLVGSVIFITHELPLLYNVTDDIMVMYAAQIAERGSAHEVVFDPLHPYAKGLMGSIIVPEEGLRDVKLTAIPGVPPNLKKPPMGCRFAERCKYVQPECMVTAVGIRDIGGGRTYRCIFSEAELREAYKNG